MSMNNYFRLKRRAGHDYTIRPLKRVDKFFSDTEEHSESDAHENGDFSLAFSKFLDENDESLI